MFSFFLIFFIQNNNAMLAESERDDGKCGCIKMQTVYLAGKTAIIVLSARATHGAARRDKREKYTIWYDNVIFRDNDFIFFLFPFSNSFRSPIVCSHISVWAVWAVWMSGRRTYLLYDCGHFHFHVLFRLVHFEGVFVAQWMFVVSTFGRQTRDSSAQ